MTWSAPEENGGTFINSYDLRAIRSVPTGNNAGNWREFRNVWRSGDGDLTARISGLTNNVSHDVQVRARNRIGEGPWSMMMPAVTGTPAVQNQAPSFPPAETGTRAILEGPEGRNVGAPVSAVDPDTGDPLTYFLSSGDEFFRIDSNTGQLLTRKALDRETTSSHALIVDVSDSKNSSDDPDAVVDDFIEVTVTVEDVNEAPEVMGETSVARDENSDLPIDVYAATDPEGGATSWVELLGADGGHFELDEFGELSFAEPPDFEARADNVYNVIVRASDDGTPPLIGELAVTVTVTPVDERPEIDGEASVVDYPENSPTTTVVGRRYTAMDPEGAGVTWSNLSGNDAGKFEFSNTGVLTFKVSPNFEQQPEYEVTLNAFDGGFTGSLTVTVTIADVNEPPTISGEVLVDFTENGTGTVEMYSAMDPDVGATQDWSLAGADGGDFEITNGVLTFINPPDYDMPTDDSRPYNEYLVTVQVNDGANTATRPVTVRVLDVNEAPTVSGNATPSVDENTTAVATYRATDPDERATITWSVEDPGASDFTITNAGALSFASAPNYEVKSSYTVTVRASDGTNNVDHSVTVTVTDEDETEELKLSARRPLIGADYTAAFKEGMGDAVQSPTWAWERSTNGTSGWTAIIIGATAATYLPVGDDRDNYLRVTASYNDGHSTKTLSATSEFATAATSTSNTPPMFPRPPVHGRRRPASRSDENADRAERSSAWRRRRPTCGARHAQLLPRGYRLHHRSAVRDQRHLKADPGRRRRRTRSRGP